MSHSSTIARRPRLDRLCAEAVEPARNAAEETGEGVGDHLGVEAEADRVATHYFECHLPGYSGWRWAVVVARAPRARNVTVSEIALLPGGDALTAPVWVPWANRLRAGDVGVGDLLPTDEQDERLAPAYTMSDDDAVEDIAFELGVGRARVMSREGRIDTAMRWYEGDRGPNAEISTSAPDDARCGTCGFYLPLAGSLRQVFGVCGNVYAQDDAQAVSADHGCGAHSEVLSIGADLVEEKVDHLDTVYDDNLVEQVETGDVEPETEDETAQAKPEQAELEQTEPESAESAAGAEAEVTEGVESVGSESDASASPRESAETVVIEPEAGKSIVAVTPESAKEPVADPVEPIEATEMVKPDVSAEVGSGDTDEAGDDAESPSR